MGSGGSLAPSSPTNWILAARPEGPDREEEVTYRKWGRIRSDEEDTSVGVEAERAISTGQLRTLLCLHTPPINQVVFLGPSGKAHLEEGFPLRCFQRLSRPHVATRQCRWRDNRNTRGASIPVLSY